jgi:hypothetical protein
VYYEAIQEQARDRQERLARDARAERLACAANGRRQLRRRRLAQDAALDLLLNARRRAAQLLNA